MTDEGDDLDYLTGVITAQRNFLIALCQNLPSHIARGVAYDYPMVQAQTIREDQNERFREGCDEQAELLMGLLRTSTARNSEMGGRGSEITG